MTPLLIAGLALLSVCLYWLGTWFQTQFFYNQISHNWWQPLLKLAYFIGLPYGTLILATIPAPMFGLTGVVTNATSQGNGSFMLVKLWLTSIFNLILTWLPHIGQLLPQGTLLALVFLAFFGIFLNYYFQTHSTQTQLLEHDRIYPQKKAILFDYAHWSFYRALIWLATNSLYTATFLGGLLILFEYLIANRIGRFSKQKQTAYLLRYGIGAVTNILFFSVSNLWLTLLFQITLSLIAELLLATMQRYHRLGQLQTPSL